MSQRLYAYNTLRNAITYGDLKPGERLVEKRLCEVYNVGRTPLREALRQLEVEGYLEFTPNKGGTISRISVEDVKNIYDLLAVLEGHATEVAATSLSEADLRKVESLQIDQKRAWAAKDYKKWLDKNADFHLSIIEASRNSYLISIVDNLRHRVYRYRRISIAIPEGIEEYIRCHDEIIHAISNGDAKRAGRAMQKHITSFSKVLIDFLKKLPGF
jgi:DNA-binding GntR family transcriptional regulator